MASAVKILTVDDQRSITESMRFFSGGSEFQVTAAETAADVLAKIDAAPEDYEAIVIGQKMSPDTGIELVHEIRKRPYAGKIIILSPHLSPDMRNAYEELDVDVMIDRPFDVKELRLLLDQLAA